MYYFSNWFPSLIDHLEEFQSVIKETRGIKEWLEHKTAEGLHYKSLYHSYSTKQPDKCIIESHRHTIDLQYCYSGGEKISYSNKTLTMSHVQYIESADKDIWNCDIFNFPFLTLKPHSFVLFKPNQLHCPGQFDGSNLHIEKIVLKLPVSFLS